MTMKEKVKQYNDEMIALRSMSNLALWEQLKAAKSEKYKWVDLTHELSPRTPHWYGFSPLKENEY